MTGAKQVFIVGMPRTGTTLTRAILNTSPQIAIGGESKFLPNQPTLRRTSRGGARGRFLRAGDIRTDVGIAQIAAEIYSQTDGYWNRLVTDMERADFEMRLRASDRSDRALFSLAMDHFARGRPISGDKTPHHVHWVPLLLEWYPEARIIHTFRDPRAIHMSLQGKADRMRAGNVRRLTKRAPLAGLYSATSVILRWRRIVALHRKYQALYPDRYMLMRFEDLVTEPRSSVKRLCLHVGVPFTEDMLDQVVVNSSFVSRGASMGIDAAVIGRWREHMSPMTRRWFTALCSRELTAFGYLL